MWAEEEFARESARVARPGVRDIALNRGGNTFNGVEDL